MKSEKRPPPEYVTVCKWTIQTETQERVFYHLSDFYYWIERLRSSRVRKDRLPKMTIRIEIYNLPL